MLKKSSFLFSLLLPISLFSIQIVDYKPEYKDAVTKIVFQDPNKLFADSVFFNRIGYLFAGFGLVSGLVGTQISNNIGRKSLYGVAAGYVLASGYVLLDNTFDFSSRKKNELEKILNDAQKKKSVLLDDEGNVIGFRETFIGKEKSIEALRKKCEEVGKPMTLTDEQCKQFFPAFKVTEAECKKILMIESVAVSRVCRGKGYGALLINDSIESAKKEGVSYADLNVANNNKGAKKLYEKLGFVLIDQQPMAFRIMGVFQLRKSLDEQA